MKIVSYINGVSARQFAMEEIQPPSGVAYNSLTEEIKKRYGFQSVGLSAEAQQKGMIAPIFERGEFMSDGAARSIFGLEMNLDGLRVTTYTTELADAFIEDLLNFVKEKYGYRTDLIIKPPLYGSTLLVRLAEEETRIFKFLDRGANLLNEELCALNKIRTVKPFGIRLIAKDDSSIPALFVFEKRMGVVTSDDVYFSQAPLPSASHEMFLRRLLHEDSAA